MESAPLNLAHFHERRAERHLKRNRFDEAIKAMQTALAYIDDAYTTISIPKAIQVLDAEKWNCSRKLKQINIRQSQHDGSKCSFPQTKESQYSENRQDDLQKHGNTSIYQAIEDFDNKYTTSTIGTLYESSQTTENSTACTTESQNWMDELQNQELPTLAPLELPSFDLDFNNSSINENDIK